MRRLSFTFSIVPVMSSSSFNVSNASFKVALNIFHISLTMWLLRNSFSVVAPGSPLLSHVATLKSFSRGLACGVVTNSSFDTPSNQLIEKLGWKTINELIDIESKTMVFKSLNELAPPYLRSLFRKNSQSTSYRLRNTSTDLRLPKKGIENGKKCFSFRGVKLWNSLSAICKQAASLSTFKQRI